MFDAEFGASLRARRLRVSINRQLVNKNEAGDTMLFVRGWVNVDMTVDEFIGSIRAGVAYCVQLTGDRKKANFLACDVVSVDIDGNRTVNDVLQDPIVRRYATFVYTTRSHTLALPRLRVVFVTPRTIATAEEMERILRSLALRLSGDPSATDAARVFYGSTGAQVWRIGRAIDDDFLDELLAQTPQKSTRVRGAIATVKSGLAIAPARSVKLASGAEMPFSEVPLRSPIFCPFHHDHQPSAFVLSSHTGTKGIHCSACNTTFWAADACGDFDFDAFDVEIRRVRECFETHQDYAPLTVLNSPLAKIGLTTTTVHIVSGEPAPPELKPGVTFVKNPKGSGKTQALVRLLRRQKRVLLVGHRRSLIRQSSARLSLKCYLDLGSGSLGGPQIDRLGICLDNILRISPRTEYDVVVLDESEQVLAHLLSDTMEKRGENLREPIFIHLRQLIRRADCVVALDADLGFTSFATIARMVSAEKTGASGTIVEPEKPLHIWHNTATPQAGKSIEVFDSESHLVSELMQAMAEGRRCFVTSNSRRRIARLAAVIAQRFPDKRQIVVTSDTVGYDEVKRFIADPQRRALDYAVILTSPSLGTGVDITFPGSATMIDVVFGFFVPLTTSHFECDQQLGRVRHPGAVKVWISPLTFQFDVNPEVVRIDIQRRNLFKTTLPAYGEHGERLYREDDPFVEMAALVTAQRRASMNDLRRHFVRYKEAQGFTVVYVGTDEDARDAGREHLRLARELDDRAYAARLLAASAIDKRGYTRVDEALKAGHQVADDEWWSLQRTKIEGFYRCLISQALIELDDRGRFRARVRMFAEVIEEARHEPPSLLARDRVVPDRVQAIRLVRHLISLTPLLREGSLDPTVTIDRRDLAAFAKYIAENKSIVENRLGFEVRADVTARAVRQLNAVLKLIGLRVVQVRTKKERGAKIYKYELDDRALRRVRAVLDSQQRSRRWDVLNDLHGWRAVDEYDDDPEEDPSDEDEMRAPRQHPAAGITGEASMNIYKKQPSIPDQPPPPDGGADETGASPPLAPAAGTAEPDLGAPLAPADDPYAWVLAYPAQHRDLLIEHGMAPDVHDIADEINQGIIGLAEAGMRGEELRRGITRIIDEAFVPGDIDWNEPFFDPDCDDIGD